MSDENTVTRLLHAAQHGETPDLARLLPLVYDELHALASRQMQAEAVGHTLQPTALVHEAFLRLSGGAVQWQDRVHFFALAAGTMRRVLVDHARAHRRGKRGGGVPHQALDDAHHVFDEATTDVLALDEALERLATREPRKARVVELHYFAGLTQPEIAESLAISTPTVERDLRFAKAWLRTELLRDGAPS